jgi:hypothetical protein
MDPLGNGRFSKDLGQLTKGTYRYTAVAEGQGASLGADSGYFAVGELALEFRETRSDASLMRQISNRSGGEFALADQVTGFVDRVMQAGTPEPRLIREVSEIPLRQIVPLLFLILAVLTTEWILRKRSGLV